MLPHKSRGTILCARCNTEKPSLAFTNDRTRPNHKFPWCKLCVNISRREARDKEPVIGDGEQRQCPMCLRGLDGVHPNRRFCSMPCKERARRIAQYGLTPSEYRTLIAAGTCPICSRKVKRWAIDHNHETGETYGPACQMCNQALLAYSYHDVEIAKRLLAFLENPPVRAILGTRKYTGPEGVSQLHRMWAWQRKKNA